ncbi:hypothetical protein SAMN05216490_0287 [Mucilaginibacter mallensis]|uniref:Uncharacterized protein n=1 Tax=Mucilaginibacter mallensis TaxID=652787 RepID=A0A1H1NCC3_MUCMA|nr:hypothetical protein [Mucilaginibacter mallensis]SDR96540.1 hypothetical protein SAMN05216490_0287 [Mucilaginibacter mallensis]
MSSNFNNRQKSLKRRFLLLGIIRLVCVVGAGFLIIIFSKKLNLNLSYTDKLIVGALFIVYGVARFVFSRKRGEFDDEE